MYRAWATAFGDDIEVCAVRLPGRETRMSEPAYSDFTLLVRETTAALRRYVDRPYAVFGHSMGAWLAFEFVRNLRLAGVPEPLHLFVSARRAPQTSSSRPKIGHLGDRELIDTIQDRYNGIPSAVLAEPDLVKLLLPALRADLVALESYIYSTAQPLTCALTVFGGTLDNNATSEQLDSWGIHTTGPFRRQLLRGDHYYLLNQSATETITQIRSGLTR
jgi:surfactin synthase thioesterase subunit